MGPAAVVIGPARFFSALTPLALVTTHLPPAGKHGVDHHSRRRPGWGLATLGASAEYLRRRRGSLERKRSPRPRADRSLARAVPCLIPFPVCGIPPRVREPCRAVQSFLPSPSRHPVYFQTQMGRREEVRGAVTSKQAQLPC